MTEEALMKRKFRVGMIVAVIVVSLVVAMLFVVNMRATAVSFESAKEQSADMSATDGFPAIDWDALLSANENVEGWITIPGTNIDYPIMQATPDDPDYYLRHDIDDEWNMWGTPFLDVDCAGRGLISSLNAPVFAHNMLDGTMFEVLTNYVDEGFAREHELIYVQTPTAKRIYKVYAADVVAGQAPMKRTSFDSLADFRSWRDVMFEGADMKLTKDATHATRTLTLVTCSHFALADERVVVYASPLPEQRH